MKKIFNKVAIVLAVAFAGMSLTSCGIEDLLSFAELLTQINGGSETTFSGVASIERDYSNDGGENWTYNPGKGQATDSKYNVTLKVLGKSAIQGIIGQFTQNGVASNSASISLGNISVEGVTLTNVELTNVAYNNGNIGDVNDEGYVYSVSYTKDGKTYTTPADFSSTPYAYVDGNLTSTADDTNAVINLNVMIILDEQERVVLEYKGQSHQ